MIAIAFFNREPDGCDLPAIPHRIVHQVVEDLDNERVCERFCTRRGFTGQRPEKIEENVYPI
jgi:hypothetical protein